MIYRANPHTVSTRRKLAFRWRVEFTLIHIYPAARTVSHATTPRIAIYPALPPRTGQEVEGEISARHLVSRVKCFDSSNATLTNHFRSTLVSGNQLKSLSILCNRGSQSSISCTRLEGSQRGMLSIRSRICIYIVMKVSCSLRSQAEGC